ncbi:MAG: hypothetical protein ACOC80_11195 [Petrotogales bacterium]
MIHKCPICRYQPVGKKDMEWFCPECGWKEEAERETLMHMD